MLRRFVALIALAAASPPDQSLCDSSIDLAHGSVIVWNTGTEEMNCVISAGMAPRINFQLKADEAVCEPANSGGKTNGVTCCLASENTGDQTEDWPCFVAPGKGSMPLFEMTLKRHNSWQYPFWNFTAKGQEEYCVDFAVYKYPNENATQSAPGDTGIISAALGYNLC